MKTRPALVASPVLLAATLLLCGCLMTNTAQAAISSGTTQSGANSSYSGNGELFLSVFDASAEISYTLDIGITQSQFRGFAQSEAGYQRFWAVNDAQWTSFLGQVSATNLRWVVQAYDYTVGSFNLFTTVQQGTEERLIDTSLIDPSNPSPTGYTTLAALDHIVFKASAGAGQAGTFFAAVNITGTHGSPALRDLTVNGSSVNSISESGTGYYGELGGATDTLNGSLGNEVTFSNTVGSSSWFYQLSTWSDEVGDPILVDEFDNQTADAYWGFIYVDPTLYPDSPYAGQYLLSYTLEGSSSAAAQAQREFAFGIGRTERTGAWRVTRLDGVAVAAAGERPAWVGSQALGVVSSVPENGTAATLLAGLGLLGAAAARRRHRGQGQG